MVLPLVMVLVRDRVLAFCYGANPCYDVIPCYVTCTWVKWPWRRKDPKNEVKRLNGPPDICRGPEGPKTSSIYNIWGLNISHIYISGQPAAAWAERGWQTQTRGFGPTSSDAQQTQINKQSELQRKSSQEFQRLSSRMCQKA